MMEKNKSQPSDPKVSLDSLPPELVDLIIEYFFADRFSVNHKQPFKVFSILGVCRRWRAAILGSQAVRLFFNADDAESIYQLANLIHPHVSQLVKGQQKDSRRVVPKRSLHHKRPRRNIMYYNFPFTRIDPRDRRKKNSMSNVIAPLYLRAEASWRQIPLIRYPLKRVQVCLSWGKPIGPNANRGYDWCIVGDVSIPGHSPDDEEPSTFVTLGLYVDLMAHLVPAGATVKHHWKTGTRLLKAQMSSRPIPAGESGSGVRFKRELVDLWGGGTRFRRFVDHGIKDQRCAVLHVCIEDMAYDASKVLYCGGALRAALENLDTDSRGQEYPVVHWWNKIFKTAFTVGPENAQMPDDKAASSFADVPAKMLPTVVSPLLPEHLKELLRNDPVQGIADTIDRLSGKTKALMV